ncbi:MAG TPA: response regulator [Gemmatimonadales bacterium]|nr:response regulator [Gemmatimonadales bacterium]
MPDASRAAATILVVDDTEANRYAVARTLRHEGYTVVEAATGREALGVARRAAPDLVLLDVRLPDLSGFEVCRLLKEDPRTAGIPVVQISTSFTDAASRVRGLEGGADAYITHPIEPAVLSATVHAMLRARRAEQAARAAREHLERSLSSVLDAFFTIDREWRVTYANAAAAATVGRTPADVVGRRLLEVVPELAGTSFAGTSFAEAYHRALAIGEAVQVEDHYPPLGAWIEARISPTPEGAAVAFRDVSARREAEEQLRHMQKMQAVGQLAGGMAHELNNMLAASMGFDHFALRALPPGHPARPDVEQSLRAQARAAQVVQQVLTFSRRQVLQPEVLDANAAIGEAEALLRRSLRHDQVLRLDLAPAPLRVRIDRTQLEQALLNVVLNARDAMPAGGTVTIRTQAARLPAEARGGVALPAGEYVLVTIEDTGAGMPPEVAARAFEPFYTTKAVGEGTGLGLSMVYGLAEQSGGAATLESVPGEGTRVRVWLPAAREHVPAPAAAPRGAEPPAAGETVLVVDDEETVRTMIARTLAAEGFRVLEAASGAAALALLAGRTEPVQLVLCDLAMPGLDGPAVAAEVRARWPGVPLLFISGYPGEEASRRGLLAPGAAFVAKPFTPETLTEAVRSNLRGP